MDVLMEKISEIETNSKQIMEEANNRKSRIAENMKSKTEAFDRELEMTTADQFSQLSKRLTGELEQKLQQQKEHTEALLIQMDQHYEDFHKNYVEQLFNRMTGE